MPEGLIFPGFDAVISTVNQPIFDDQYIYVDAAIEAKYSLGTISI